MRQKLIFSGLLLVASSAMSQPNYDMQQIKREHLNRGVVAIRNGQQVVVSWRTLTSDKEGEAFDIYRNGVKLNKKALTENGNDRIFERYDFRC